MQLVEVEVMAPKSLAIDMTGRKIGKLTVVGIAKRTGKTPGTHWLCRCECGRDRVVVGSWLRRAEKLGHSPTCDVCRALQSHASLEYDPDEDLEQKPRRGGRRCKKSKWCGTCGGLSFRVEGGRCEECGLAYAPEKEVSIEDLPQHRYWD